MTTQAMKNKVLAQRVLARRRFEHFVTLTHPAYQMGWVHKDICTRLQRFSDRVIAGESPRLMLLMPPRHGKSELASIRFPAWHLGRAPSHEIINASYNIDLPMGFSRTVRTLLRSPVYKGLFKDTLLNNESQSVEEWRTMAGGGFKAAGVGGGITGKGAHILVIDDPLKNQEEADAIGTRDKLWDWYQSTAYTRLAPGGGILVIETWWNDDDLAGRLQALAALEADADQFEVVRYPALSTQWEYRDPETFDIHRHDERISEELRGSLELLRPIDTGLHLDRYPTKVLKKIRANLQPRIWSALYQQNPTPDGGMYFKQEDFRFEPQLPEPRGCNIYTAWDFAITQKQQSDWTVGATIMQDTADMAHVANINRFKGDTLQIVEAIIDEYERWGRIPGVSYQVGVEDGQIWRALQPVLKRRMRERSATFPIEVLRPLTDKMARARPLQGRVQMGKVVFPEGPAWATIAVHEMLRFPAGAHDDIVDALAWAIQLSMNRPAPRPPARKKAPSWRDALLAGMGGQKSYMAA